VKRKIQNLQSVFDFDRFILKLQVFEVLFEQRSRKGSVNQKIRIRFYFFGIYQAKMDDCAPAPAAGNLLRLPLNRNYNHPDNEIWLLGHHLFFAIGLKFPVNSNIAHRFDG
jgi:hypothetical protein